MTGAEAEAEDCEIALPLALLVLEVADPVAVPLLRSIRISARFFHHSYGSLTAKYIMLVLQQLSIRLVCCIRKPAASSTLGFGIPRWRNTAGKSTVEVGEVRWGVVAGAGDVGAGAVIGF